jgi:hypothetical protein
MPTLSSVSLRPDPNHATFISVYPVWRGVDRPVTLGWSIPSDLTPRLVSAILSGAAFKNPVVKRDVEGKTYVDHDCTVTARYMAEDLERLGF